MTKNLSKAAGAPRIVVAGASGRLGRIVVQQLLAAGVSNLVAASRTPEKLSNLTEKGIEVRFADFNEPDSLTQAFKDAEAMLLISTDDLLSGRRISQHKNAIEGAKKAGVKHIVYTSMPNPEQATGVYFSPDHVATEAALRDSGVTHTILRVSWYSENLRDVGYLSAAWRSGKWISSAKDGRIAYVPCNDVGRTVAAVLARVPDASKTYTLTGPAALTPEELAAALSSATGKEIQVVRVTAEELKPKLFELGLSDKFASMVAYTDGNTRAGNFNIVTTTIEDFTGQPPMSFEDFLKANVTMITQ